RRVELHFSGSNDLLAKLKINDEGDLYFPADERYLRDARAAGIVAESIPVATMRAVVLARPGNPRGIDTFGDLLRRDVRVALARPESAAIGAVTRDVLADRGLWDRLDRNITAETATVNESANAVEAGAAD